MSWAVRAAGKFKVPAVHFNPQTFLKNIALQTIDNNLISFSYWFRVNELPQSFWVVNPEDPRDENDLQENYSYLNYDNLGSFNFEPFVSSISIHTACGGPGGVDLNFSAYNPLYGDRMLVEASTSFSLGDWHHLIGTVDTNHPVHEKKFKIYIDDVDVTAPERLIQEQGIPGQGNWTTGADSIFYTCQQNSGPPDFIVTNSNFAYFTNPASPGFTPLIAGLPFQLGWDGSGIGSEPPPTGFVGDLSEFWFAVGVSLLDDDGNIPEETRRKFISEDGKPVVLGAHGELPLVTEENPNGTPPTIYGSGGKSKFLQPNLGTGGDFILTGTLDNADSEPGLVA